MNREDARLVGQMAGEFLELLSLLPTEQSGAAPGTRLPAEAVEVSERMDATAAEIKARREQGD